MNCTYCGEPIDRPADPRNPCLRLHRECLARMIVGSVGHQLGRCCCHGGTEEDPEGMTRREGAIAALEHFRLTQALTN